MAGSGDSLSSNMSLDSTDFKTGLQQANRELRLLDSEFKASVATMGDWSKNSEGLQQRTEMLTRSLDLQSKRVEAVRAEYERVAAEKGENSRAAQELEIQLNRETEKLGKLSKELVDTEEALGQMGNESGKTGKEVGKVGDESKKAEKEVKTLGDRLKDLGKGVADGLAGVGDKIAGIGKAAGIAVGAVVAGAAAGAVKLGQAVINQFGELEQNLGGSEAVFQDYADHMQKIGEDAYKNLGVSQSQYLATANKMGALFQGSGLDVQKSAELSEKAMQRAADMASRQHWIRLPELPRATSP